MGLGLLVNAGKRRKEQNVAPLKQKINQQYCSKKRLGPARKKKKQGVGVMCLRGGRKQAGLRLQGKVHWKADAKGGGRAQTRPSLKVGLASIPRTGWSVGLGGGVDGESAQDVWGEEIACVPPF